MTKAIAAWGLGLVLTGQAPAVPAAVPWNPQVGDALQYRMTDGGSASLRVVRVQQEAARTVATMEQIVELGAERRTRRLTLLRSDDGLALRLPGTEQSDFGPIVCFLREAVVADTWTAQKGAYQDTRGERVEFRLLARLEALETVTVAAGTFPNCRRIAYRLAYEAHDPSDAMTALWVWVKPEVGIIKTRSEHGGQVTETELAAYTLGTRRSGR